MWQIVLIGFSLALDCFAVSVAGGACVKSPRFKNALKIGAFFGVFQAIMPLIGLGLGYALKQFISNFTHWIAFALLLAIGIKMIVESFKKEESKKRDILNNYTLLILAVATSIDALIIGFTLAFIEIPIVYSVIIIGLFSFTLSISGYYLGHRISGFFKDKVEIIGGVILIGIGLKILLEHYL